MNSEKQKNSRTTRHGERSNHPWNSAFIRTGKKFESVWFVEKRKSPPRRDITVARTDGTLFVSPATSGKNKAASSVLNSKQTLRVAIETSDVKHSRASFENAFITLSMGLARWENRVVRISTFHVTFDVTILDALHFRTFLSVNSFKAVNCC